MFTTKSSPLVIFWAYLIIQQAYPASAWGLWQNTFKVNESAAIEHKPEDEARHYLHSDYRRVFINASTIELSAMGSPTSDIKDICISLMGKEDTFFECKKEQGFNHVCIDTANEKTVLCLQTQGNYPKGDIYEEQFYKQICVNTTSRRVVLCDQPTTHICHQNREKSSSGIEICKNKDKQLCFSEPKGYIESCESNAKFVDPMSEMEGDWWKEWMPNAGHVKQPKMGDRLCFAKEKAFVECGKDASKREVCVSPKNGDIRACHLYSSDAMAIPICTEANSNKIITCGGNNNAILCFPPRNGSGPLKPCRHKYRQVCLDNNGLLQRCLNGGESVQLNNTNRSNKESNIGMMDTLFSESIDDSKAWEYFRMANILYRSGKLDSVKRSFEYLCKFKDYVKCEEDNSTANVCVSAKDGKIGKCLEFKNGEPLISLCRDKKTKQLITCDKHMETNLCFSSTRKGYFVPCNSESRFACMDEGKIQGCSPNAEPERRFKRASPGNAKSSDGGNLDETADYENYDDEHRLANSSVRLILWNKHLLCKVDEDGDELRPCEKDGKWTFACFGAISGRVELCEKSPQTDIIIPVCMEISTNYLVTCGVASNVNLCLMGKGLLSPCIDAENYACIGEDGMRAKCPKNPETTTGYSDYTEQQFFRINCNDCSIKSKFIVVGTPDDVLPELEVITFEP